MQPKARKKEVSIEAPDMPFLLSSSYFINIALPSLATDTHSRTRTKATKVIKMKIQVTFSLHRCRELLFSFTTSVSFRACPVAQADGTGVGPWPY